VTVGPDAVGLALHGLRDLFDLVRRGRVVDLDELLDVEWVRAGGRER
jgi:hypothetical protein